jgi:carbon starvation protein CstA
MAAKRCSGAKLGLGPEERMTISTILIIIVILLLIGAVPSWPHSRAWGYGPSGVLGVILVILILVLLTRGSF